MASRRPPASSKALRGDAGGLRVPSGVSRRRDAAASPVGRPPKSPVGRPPASPGARQTPNDASAAFSPVHSGSSSAHSGFFPASAGFSPAKAAATAPATGGSGGGRPSGAVHALPAHALPELARSQRSAQAWEGAVEVRPRSAAARSVESKIQHARSEEGRLELDGRLIAYGHADHARRLAVRRRLETLLTAESPPGRRAPDFGPVSGWTVDLSKSHDARRSLGTPRGSPVRPRTADLFHSAQVMERRNVEEARRITALHFHTREVKNIQKLRAVEFAKAVSKMARYEGANRAKLWLLDVSLAARTFLFHQHLYRRKRAYQNIRRLRAVLVLVRFMRTFHRHRSLARSLECVLYVATLLKAQNGFRMACKKLVWCVTFAQRAWRRRAVVTAAHAELVQRQWRLCAFSTPVADAHLSALVCDFLRTKRQAFVLKCCVYEKYDLWPVLFEVRASVERGRLSRGLLLFRVLRKGPLSRVRMRVPLDGPVRGRCNQQ
ncbi:hypothetical protein M885DRAFT_188420 [Pelagophyceae sp. CCMP2097]|nr:hypothetical protein M885DRAFT_188420 [Pelagophyceae sp. CCMP2097]